ncbi:MAG: ABC transporter substrate-binding protein, partial [Aminobacteriaceae bacterium]
MKRKLTAILCCVFLGIFAVSAAAAVTITVGQGAEPVELDPQNITDNPSEELCFQIYEGLVGFDVKDGRLEIAPRLADKWEVSEDGKAWTFSLKKGVQFHSGAPFNAEAVKKNFERLLSGKYKRSSLFSPFLSEVKVVDEFTVQFILSMSFGPFLHTMCHTAGVIIDPARIDANADIKNNPSGTGPFAFK